MPEQEINTLLKKSFVEEIEKLSVWEELLKKSVVDVDQLAAICKGNIDKEKLNAVIRKYPMRINPYYLSLIKKKDDAIWKQCIPDLKENHQGADNGGDRLYTAAFGNKGCFIIRRRSIPAFRFLP